MLISCILIPNHVEVFTRQIQEVVYYQKVGHT